VLDAASILEVVEIQAAPELLAFRYAVPRMTRMRAATIR
jgi:hypothetical protein